LLTSVRPLYVATTAFVMTIANNAK